MTPEIGKEMELSQQNWQAWAFFNQAHATGLTEQEKRDPIVRRIFAIVSRLTDAARQQEQVQGMANEIVRLFNRRTQA